MHRRHYSTRRTARLPWPAACAAIAATLLHTPAHAATSTWTGLGPNFGTGTTLWTVPGNWSPVGPPPAANDV